MRSSKIKRQIFKKGTILSAFLLLILSAFAPVGAYAETINYDYDDTGQLKAVKLGDGATPGAVQSYEYDEVGNRTSKSVTKAAISVSPSSLAFGIVGVGVTSPAKTITVTNTGSADLAVNSITFTGTDSTSFLKQSDTCIGALVAPAGSCQIQVASNPVSVGTKTASVSIQSNDLSTPLLNVALSANATISILGNITYGGNPLPGITVTLTGQTSATTTTDSFGNYIFSGLTNGTYNVRPSNPCTTFTPSYSSVTISGTSIVKNFTGNGSCSISGQIISTVTMTLSGDASATTTSASGSYSFTGLSSGSYIVTPSKTSYRFDPNNKTVNISTASVGNQNFTVYKTHLISGTITYSGNPLPDATVVLSGNASAITTTNSSGYYSFTVDNGSYTVTPSMTGYAFTPVYKTINNLDNSVGDKPLQNFTALALYSITGSVMYEGNPLSGVTMTFSGGASGTTTTDSSGFYTFNVVNGSYTVTPSKTGFKFTPSSLAVTISNANVPDQNFTGNLSYEVESLDAWNNIRSSSPNNTSGTITAGSFAVGSGPNRLLLVSVIMRIGNNANPAISAYYGGTQLALINMTANSHKEVVWMGYLKDSQIGSGTKDLTITYSGASGNALGLHVKWASYTGVNQSTPIVSTGAVNNGNNSVSFGSTINYVNKGMTVVVSGNNDTPASGTLTATPAFTAGTATTSDYHSSNTFTTAKHTADGSYASSTQVSWSGTTGGQSGLVVVSLQPAPAAYRISGTITNSEGAVMSGVTVNLTGTSSGSTTTNSEGKFSFSNNLNGNYTITPSLAGYIFTPANRSVTINGANITGQDFTGTVNPTIYSISGTITSSGGAAMSGVTVNLTGALSATTTTDTNGAYSFDNLANGNYTVTPGLTGYSFSPSAISLTVNGSDVPNQNFTGSLLTGVTTFVEWNNIHSSSPNNTSGTITAKNFAVDSGSQRVLLVAVVMKVGTNVIPSISAYYGGVQLTPFSMATDTNKEVVWMGYLTDAQIGTGSKTLTITYSGASNNVLGLHVKYAVYAGVNQTNPVAGSGAMQTRSNSVTFGSTVNYVNNGMTIVVAGNNLTQTNVTLTATPAFTPGTATTSDYHTSMVFTTAKHTSSGSYPSSTTVSWSGTTGGHSGLVVVSLQP